MDDDAKRRSLLRMLGGYGLIAGLGFTAYAAKFGVYSSRPSRPANMTPVVIFFGVVLVVLSLVMLFLSTRPRT
jgi:hypothetical protein